MGHSFSMAMGLPVVVLGEVGDERHGHAHIDTCPNGDWQHGQEESPPRTGARQVEVSFRHRLVGLLEEGGGEGEVEKETEDIGRS